MAHGKKAARQKNDHKLFVFISILVVSLFVFSLNQEHTGKSINSLQIPYSHPYAYTIGGTGPCTGMGDPLTCNEKNDVSCDIKMNVVGATVCNPQIMTQIQAWCPYLQGQANNYCQLYAQKCDLKKETVPGKPPKTITTTYQCKGSFVPGKTPQGNCQDTDAQGNPLIMRSGKYAGQRYVIVSCGPATCTQQCSLGEAIENLGGK